MFVYLITNIINGKRYVGQTKRPLARRWSQHCSSVGCCALNNAIRKYGKENFIVEPICEPPTVELMDEFEQEYIERYNTLFPNGYNLMTGGSAPHHSEETCKKISEGNKGKIGSRKGVTLSEETKRRISESKIGVKQPLWAIAKRVLSQTGGKRSEETKKKMSESAKLDWQKRRDSGYRLSDAAKKNMSEARLGKKLSEETKALLRGRKVSEESKAKMKEAWIIRRSKKSNVGSGTAHSTKIAQSLHNSCE